MIAPRSPNRFSSRIRARLFFGKIIAKPRISRDEQWIYFTADIPVRWSAWRVNLHDGRQERIGQGCQPDPFDNGSGSLWMRKRKNGSGTDIMRYPNEGKRSQLEHFSGEKTFAYYPTLTPSGEFLLFSQCRCEPKANSHEAGNYELVVVNTAEKSTKVLTNNGATNRWPRLIPHSE